MMEDYDEDMYPDRMRVYPFVQVRDSENVPGTIEGEPGDPVPCAVIDPTLATPMASGVEPMGRDMVTIYAPRDPGVTAVNQLVEVVDLGTDPPTVRDRIRTTSAGRDPKNIFPCWTIVGQRVTG